MKFHQSSLEKYFKNTSWLVGERLLRIGIAFMVGIYVARYLGPEKFGLLNYAISFVGLFAALATLGLDKMAVRALVKDPATNKITLGTVFWLKLIGALLVLVIIYLSLSLTNNTFDNRLLVLIIAAGLLFQPFNVIDLFFQSQVLSKYVVKANIIQVGISSITKIVLIISDAPLFWFALVILGDSIFLALALIYFFFKQKTQFLSKNVFSIKSFSSRRAKDLLYDSWPLIFSGIVVSVYMKIDQVMLKEMLGAKAVGLYAVAVQLSEAWYFIPTLALQSVFPAIISLHANDKKLYKIRLQQLHDMLTAIAFIIAILITVLSDDIIRILFGGQFFGASAILSIHIWTGIFVFPGNIRAHLIIVENKQLIALLFRTIGAVVNVALNYFLIPIYGGIGAAWATLASFTLPVFIVALFDPVIKLSVLMSMKSYVLPIRFLVRRKYLYHHI